MSKQVTIKELIRDISGAVSESEENSALTTQLFKRSRTNSRLSGKKTFSSKGRDSILTNDDKSIAGSPHRRYEGSINIKIRPVEETYNCRKNKNKFCMPLGEPSARILEETFELEKKMRIAAR